MVTTRKAPDIGHLEELQAELEEARQAVSDLCAALTDPARLTPEHVVPAFEAWQRAASAWNGAVCDAAAEVRDFMDTRTDQWLESACGRAYEELAIVLEDSEVVTEDAYLLRLTISMDIYYGGMHVTVENATRVLPETPDLPELDM